MDDSKAMRLLENLTPGGSEYVNNPERCAKWVEDRLSNAQRITVDAVARRKEAEAALDAARADVARLREALRAVAIGENLDEDEASPDRYCWCPFGWQGDDVPYCLQARAALTATEAQP